MAYETSSFNMSIKDHSKEISSLRVNVGLITAANLAARITARDAFIDAVEAVINGTIQDSSLGLDKKFNTSAPADDEASREKKILVVMEDNTTMKRFSFTIPCRKSFDGGFGVIPYTDQINMTLAGAAALKTAVEAFVVSPAGNAGTVVEMISVGRNL